MWNNQSRLKKYTKDILKRLKSLIQSHDKRPFATSMERDLKLTKLEDKKMTAEQAE